MKSKATNKRKNKHYTYSSAPNQSKIHLLPLIFVILILPFIMRFHYYNPGLSQYPWFGNLTKATDVFLYYKQIFFIFAASIMLLALLYRFYKNHWKFQVTPILIPMLLYCILAFLSTIFSKYSSFGFSGIYEQFESVFVLIGYVMVLLYAFEVVNTEDDLKTINKYLLISILLFSILGLSQATGHDFFRTVFGKKLYVPSASWGMLDQLEFKFPNKTAYLTLYNPNYAGVYSAFVIPIIIGLFIMEKEIKLRIAYGIAVVGMIITLIASGSVAGIICLTISFFIAIIIFRKKIFYYKKAAIAAVLLLSVIVLSVFILKLDTIKSILDNKFAIAKVTHDLSAIETGDNLEITYNGNKLFANYSYENSETDIVLTDADNKTIKVSPQNSSGEFIIKDERFSGIAIIPTMYNNILCLDFKINNKDWVFSNQTGDNTFYYLNPAGQFDKLKTADSALFTGYENVASGRGYIWSRTIPLLKKYIILGSGADSFVLAFPQQDYLNLYYTGFEGELLSKPHSLYLQMGVQTGVLSLIAFLVFYIMYFISSLRLYFKCNFDSYWEKVGASYFIGTISYMIAGIANDSTITIAPVFWTIIGIGIAINYKLSKSLTVH